MNLAADNGDNPRDEDWIPEKLCRKQRAKKSILQCMALWNEIDRFYSMATSIHERPRYWQ
jgi:hypothetical protein